MLKNDQREAMIAFLNTFGKGQRGGRGNFIADGVVANNWMLWKDELRGKENFENQFLKPLLESFQDLDFRIFEHYMGDNFVVQRGEFNGTFKSRWANCEPNGESVKWRAHDIYEFKNGKVVRVWLGNDTLNVARQIGALPDDGNPW